MRTLLLALLFLTGCVNAPYKTPPSTAAAQKSVNSARGAIESSSVHDQKARTNAELIDNKASVIERYWK